MSKKLTVGSDNVTSLYVGTQKVKKIYAGSELVYESTPLPVKGDVLLIEYKPSTTGRFRVLSINGNIAKICSQFDLGDARTKYSELNSNVYQGSNADMLMLDTFLPSFTTTLQNAIIPHQFTQEQWSTDDTGSEVYVGKNSSSNAYYISLQNPNYGNTITRKLRLMCVRDVLESVGATTSMSIDNTTLTKDNIISQVVDHGAVNILMDANNSTSRVDVMDLQFPTGSITHVAVNYVLFTFLSGVMYVDLSKIQYTIET